MTKARTGSVEPFKRADGRVYFRARIRLADGSRERVDAPVKCSTPAAPRPRGGGRDEAVMMTTKGAQ